MQSGALTWHRAWAITFHRPFTDWLVPYANHIHCCGFSFNATSDASVSFSSLRGVLVTLGLCSEKMECEATARRRVPVASYTRGLSATWGSLSAISACIEKSFQNKNWRLISERLVLSILPVINLTWASICSDVELKKHAFLSHFTTSQASELWVHS